MNNLLSLLDNGQTLDLDSTKWYAAILGETPSQGARSPVLWNTAFTQEKIDAVMHPMDIPPDRLEQVVTALKADSRFIGGAVTMPYKIDILPFLDSIEPEAEIIGAVNCIYRTDEGLVGTNTDGAGALWSLEQKIRAAGGELNGKTILLTGTGGAGRAVAAYVASAIGEQGSLRLANRSRDSAETLASRLAHTCRTSVADWPVQVEDITGVDVVINCSSVGFENLFHDDNGFFSLKPYSPLAPINETLRVDGNTEISEKQYCRQALPAVRENLIHTMDLFNTGSISLVFDIIYQPEKTVLLFLAGLAGCDTLNGKAMNLEQAVIAYDMATVASGLRPSNRDSVRCVMARA